MSHEDADELVRRMKQGDKQALEKVFAKIRPYLRRIAERELDPRMKGRLDPSDLVQEALVKGNISLREFEGETLDQFRAYLRTALRHNAIDAHRAVDANCRAVNAERSLDDNAAGQHLRERLRSERTSPSQLTARKELVQLSENAMMQLSDQQRQALVMWQASFRASEIAARLRITESAASSLVKHALRKLRELLTSPIEDRCNLSPALAGPCNVLGATEQREADTNSSEHDEELPLH